MGSLEESGISKISTQAQKLPYRKSCREGRIRGMEDHTKSHDHCVDWFIFLDIFF